MAESVPSEEGSAVVPLARRPVRHEQEAVSPPIHISADAPSVASLEVDNGPIDFSHAPCIRCTKRLAKNPDHECTRANAFRNCDYCRRQKAYCYRVSTIRFVTNSKIVNRVLGPLCAPGSLRCSSGRCWPIPSH